jgi:uncharacterized membrane protein YhaH (DUF805 family)
MDLARKLRALPWWFWLYILAAAVVVGLFHFLSGWAVTAWIGPWLREHDIVEPLTIGLAVVAALLVALFLWQRRLSRAR